LKCFKKGSGIAVQELRATLLTNSIFFIVVGLMITLFVHVNCDLPLREIIQANASESAVEILTKVINEVDGFAGNSEKSDDVTLVIIKVEVQ